MKKWIEWRVGSKDPSFPKGARCPVCKKKLPNEQHPQAQVEYCPECGGLLGGEGQNRLRCPKCGEKFHRGNKVKVWWRIICPKQKFGGGRSR